MKLTLSAVALILGSTMAHAASNDIDGDGVPNDAEALLHSDPMVADTDGDGMNDLADDNAVFAADPMTASTTAAPFRIGELLVENNVDPVAHKDADDHLEIQVINDSAAPLSGFTLYYMLTDNESGATEAYIAHPDLTVPANGDARIHVDASDAAGHLRANPNSIYVTSQAGKHVSVSLQLDGSAPVTATIEKDAGGAEQAD